MRGAEADRARPVRALHGRARRNAGRLARGRAGGERQAARAAVVADFVAGMTDRYAIKEHRRLFDATPELR